MLVLRAAGACSADDKHSCIKRFRVGVVRSAVAVVVVLCAVSNRPDRKLGNLACAEYNVSPVKCAFSLPPSTAINLLGLVELAVSVYLIHLPESKQCLLY